MKIHKFISVWSDPYDEERYLIFGWNKCFFRDGCVLTRGLISILISPIGCKVEFSSRRECIQEIKKYANVIKLNDKKALLELDNRFLEVYQVCGIKNTILK